MIVSAIQAALSWQDRQKNLQHLGSMMEAAGDADLFVLPEMFSTGFTMEPERYAEEHEGEAFRWMQRMAWQKRAVVTGSISVRDHGKYYNRLYWVKPDGTYSMYDKRHLFRMGEEHHHYSAGTARALLKCGEFSICPLVCYDLRFPVWSRNRFDRKTSAYEYDLLIYVANWPAVRSYAWKQLLVARAIENQCFVAGVNRVGADGNNVHHSGGSMVIGPKGELLRAAEDDREEVISCSLDVHALREFRDKFPAGQDADEFSISI